MSEALLEGSVSAAGEHPEHPELARSERLWLSVSTVFQMTRHAPWVLILIVIGACVLRVMAAPDGPPPDSNARGWFIFAGILCLPGVIIIFGKGCQKNFHFDFLSVVGGLSILFLFASFLLLIVIAATSSVVAKPAVFLVVPCFVFVSGLATFESHVEIERSVTDSAEIWTVGDKRSVDHNYSTYCVSRDGHRVARLVRSSYRAAYHAPSSSRTYETEERRKDGRTVITKHHVTTPAHDVPAVSSYDGQTTPLNWCVELAWYIRPITCVSTGFFLVVIVLLAAVNNRQ